MAQPVAITFSVELALVALALLAAGTMSLGLLAWEYILATCLPDSPRSAMFGFSFIFFLSFALFQTLFIVIVNSTR